jgi:hypothetical protein
MTWNDLSSGAASGMVASLLGHGDHVGRVPRAVVVPRQRAAECAGGGGKSLLFFLPKALRDRAAARRTVSDARSSATFKAAMAKESDDVADRAPSHRAARAPRRRREHCLVRADRCRSEHPVRWPNRDDASHKHGVPPAVRTYNLRKTFTNPDGKEFVAEQRLRRCRSSTASASASSARTAPARRRSSRC